MRARSTLSISSFSGIVDVGSKEVVEGLLLVACVGLAMDCLHKRCMRDADDNPTARTC